MGSRIARWAATLGLMLMLVAVLPATVLAECNGPTCGPPDTGVEGGPAIVFILILVVFGAAMAWSEARRPLD
jgi:hypothetical protein